MKINVIIHTKEWPRNNPEEIVEDNTENCMTTGNHNSCVKIKVLKQSKLKLLNIQHVTRQKTDKNACNAFGLESFQYTPRQQKEAPKGQKNFKNTKKSPHREVGGAHPI